METNEDSCEGCPAPCCGVQQTPHAKPEFEALVDWTRYFLLFPNTELVVSATGEYYFLRWQQCSLFLVGECKCSVHNTDKQPDICKIYSARNCWYKRNFVTDEPKDVCRLNLERFELWSSFVRYDGGGKIIAEPDYAAMVTLTRHIPVYPRFEMNTQLVKDGPLAGS